MNLEYDHTNNFAKKHIRKIHAVSIFNNQYWVDQNKKKTERKGGKNPHAN